jgi:hypothetical protein
LIDRYIINSIIINNYINDIYKLLLYCFIIYLDTVMDKLTARLLEHHVQDIMEKVKTFLPNSSNEEKKLWVRDQLVHILESFDNQLPAIGAFMDLPAIDAVEVNAVEKLVDFVWSKQTFFPKTDEVAQS